VTPLRPYRNWRCQKRFRSGLGVSVGLPVHRPFLGIERCAFQNGVIWRLSLWPGRFGFYFSHWRERVGGAA
jgi:hypothetical protein